jgi:hypothetical protein
MKRWPWIVAGLYGLILIALTVPAILLAFAPKMIGAQGSAAQAVAEAAKVYKVWVYWAWLAIMVLGQVALLAVPMRVASRRPVTKGALWRTVLAGGLMAGALLIGAIYSILEFVFRDHGADWMGWGPIAAGVLTWGIWSVLFFRLGRRAEPANLITRQCSLLLKGSILELLIAVPTHIVARSRDYCCAGWLTFIGLTMGISVMLFSFGPAVFFLYVERWKRLHPTTDS